MDPCTYTAICWWLTCVSVKDLAAVGEQLKHLQLAAVGGHHNVAVSFPQKLHVQHLIIITHKLQECRRRKQKREKMTIKFAVWQ